MLWLDDYERQARLAPGVLALFPVIAVGLVYGIRFSPVMVPLLSFLTLAGSPLFLAEFVRHQGRKVQEQLWNSWGGAPTTLKLRLRETEQGSVRRDAWRKSIVKATGVELLSLRAERANFNKADETIDLAVSKLRDLTRDAEKFPLLKKENRGYGFQRNLYGIRWLARSVALAVLFGVCSYLLWIYYISGQEVFAIANLAALAVALFFLFFWMFAPSVKRVMDSANAYANELLNAAILIADDGRDGG